LSVCRLLTLQQKPKLSHTQPLTGLHAVTHRPRVRHSWPRY